MTIAATSDILASARPRTGLLAVGLLLAACRSASPAGVATVPPPVLPVGPVCPPSLATREAAVAAAAPAELPIGVQLFEADVDTPALEHLRAAGVTWARTRALWKLIEPVERTPPVYDWAATDRLFGDTAAAGFRNVAVVYANPPWAAASECGPVAPPKRARYEAFWSALVERYDGDGLQDAPGGARADYWQVSNEADFDHTAPSDEADYGGCFGQDPAGYAEQLVLAYRAAKAADPRARVGLSPMAYDRFTAASAPAGWGAAPGPFVYDFAQRVLEHLYATYPGDPALPFFDFVSLHSYNDNAHFWDLRGSTPRLELVGKAQRFRTEQLAVPGVFDLRGMPILISETGLASSPSDEWTERSEDFQAMYVGQAMVRALAIGAIAAIWYTARDNLVGDCAPPHWDWLTYGLMRSQEVGDALQARCPIHPWIAAYPLDSPATPRPALRALGTLTAALRGSTFQRQLDPAETGDDAIEAFAFRDPQGRVILAAWTTTGERLGRRGVETISASLAVTCALLTPWSGRIIVTDHLGAQRTLGDAGATTVTVSLEAAPVYLTAAH
jgi:hypothetical protein